MMLIGCDYHPSGNRFVGWTQRLEKPERRSWSMGREKPSGFIDICPALLTNLLRRVPA